MKNIAIIHLGSSRDIISLLPVIKKLKATNVNLSIICKDNFPFKDVLYQFLDEVIDLPIGKIQKILRSKIYPDSYAVQLLNERLMDCRETSWDQVISLSSDSLTMYITNLFNSKVYKGKHLNNKNQVLSSSKSNLIYNFSNSTLSKLMVSPIKLFLDDLTGSLDYPETKWPLDNEKQSLAKTNLSTTLENLKPGARTVGVNIDSLCVGDETIDSAMSLIEDLHQNEEFLPVLLLKTGDHLQESIVNELNKKTNNKLVSIKFDPGTIAEIISSLDILVTQKHYMASLSDILGVKTYEILKPGDLPCFNHANNVAIQVHESQFHNEINYLLNISFNTTLPVDSFTFKNYAFESQQSSSPENYHEILGPEDNEHLIQNILLSESLNSYLGHNYDKDNLMSIHNDYDKEILNSVYTRTMAAITDSSRTLLNLLREHKKEGQDKPKKIVFYLQELFTKMEETTTLSLLSHILEGSISGISETFSLDTSRSDRFEKSLFEVKKLLIKYAEDVEYLNPSNFYATQPKPKKEASNA